MQDGKIIIPGAPSKSAIDKDTKNRILKFIKENNLNEFGDPKDTVYAGGTPLFNESTGEQTDLYAYLLKKFPHLRSSS
jgi:hypothetical protein